MPPIRGSGSARRLRLLAVVAAAALLLVFAASWAAGSFLMRSSTADVAPPQPPGRDVTLRSTDGVRLSATFWPGARPGGPAVLLLHGNDASRAAMMPNAEWLSGQGYAVLALDFRGHGESQPQSHSFGLFESRDAEAAFLWLKRASGGPVAVVGVSLGGAATLIGPKGPLPADALVLQAVYPDIRHAIRNRIAGFLGRAPAALLEPLLSFQSRPRLGVGPTSLSPLAAIGAYRGPVLVIGGTGDASTPPDETRALFAAAPGPKRLWFARGTDHRATSDLRSPEYRRELLRFLRDTIGSP